MTLVGIHAGVTIDHIVTAPLGARFDCLGGPALFASLGARLVAGTHVRLATLLPEAESRFEDLFLSLGIDLGHTTRVAEVPRLWILNSPVGRRILPLAPGYIELAGGQTSQNQQPSTDCPHPPPGFADGLDGLLASNPIRRPDDAGSTLVGIDPDQLQLAHGGVDYLARVVTPRTVLLPSRVHLRLTNPDPLAAARDWSEGFGVPVVARLDVDGMHVYTGGEHWALQDPKVSVLETTGAGDASAAAIVAALSAGAHVVDAALMGISVARLALSGWGHEGLLTDPLTEPFPQIRTRKA